LEERARKDIVYFNTVLLQGRTSGRRRPSATSAKLIETLLQVFE